jgi:hypothetical protein
MYYDLSDQDVTEIAEAALDFYKNRRPYNYATQILTPVPTLEAYAPGLWFARQKQEPIGR